MTKAQRVFNMPTAMKDSKKCFYKYINNKMRGKDNLHPLLHMGRNIVTKEKTEEVLTALFVSVFNSNTSFSLVPSLLSWRTGMGRTMKPP